MKLKKKKDDSYKPVYKEKEPEYKKVYVDWKKYCVDMDAVIPHGKYAGRILEEILQEDEWYAGWMRDNNIIASWGMIKLRNEEPKKKYAHHRTPEGELWVGIREIDQITQPSQWI